MCGTFDWSVFLIAHGDWGQTNPFALKKRCTILAFLNAIGLRVKQKYVPPYSQINAAYLNQPIIFCFISVLSHIFLPTINSHISSFYK